MFAVHIQYKGTGPMDRKQESFIKAESEEEAEGIARNKLFELKYYGIPGTADVYALNHESTFYSDGQTVVAS